MGVEKWKLCKFSVVFGYGGEDGYALKEAGYNENYGCERLEIVQSGHFPTTFIDSQIAKLCDIGKYDDPEVIKALTMACANCRFFKPK